MIRSGAVTIVDMTDISTIENWYLATDRESGVTIMTEGWTTTIQTMDSSHPYLWTYEVIKGTNNVIIHTTVPVIIGRYGNDGADGANGADGAAGRGISNIVEYYAINNSTTPPIDADFDINVLSPTSTEKFLWNYSIIYYTDNTSDSTDKRVIGVYGDQGIQGEPGTPGEQGVSVTSVEFAYYLKTDLDDPPQDDTEGSTSVPDFIDGGVYYSRTITHLSDGNTITGPWLVDNALTNENQEAHDAWTAAGLSEQRTKKIINNSSGVIVTGGVQGGNVNENDTSTYGYNTIMAPNYLGLRYNTINLSKFTTAGIELYTPVLSGGAPAQGPVGLELTSNAITFYNPNSVNHNAQLIIGANGTLQSGNYLYRNDLAEKRFSQSGSKIDLIYGDIITPKFRLASGELDGIEEGAYIQGTIEALDGYIKKLYIGTNENNYWEVGDFINYDQSLSASLISNGTAFIQLGQQNTWRLSTDRIHTAWITNNSTALTFPIYDGKYWDWGIHSPHLKNNVWRDKFLYIRNATYDAQSPQIATLTQDIDDDLGIWNYQFWIDRSGNVHAPAYYIGEDPLIGGVGSIAEKIINADSTYGKGGVTQPIYIDSNGRPATTTYQLNEAGSKGVVTTIGNDSSNLPTVTAVKNYIANQGFLTTDSDYRVQTSRADTTKLYLVGTATAGTTTGTLSYDNAVYLNTTAGDLRATTFNGRTLRAASERSVDTQINAETPSTSYLPTSAAVADYIASLEYATISDLSEQVAAESKGIGYGLTSHTSENRVYIDLPTINQGAQTTLALYPITIDSFGKISSYGNAITPLTSSNIINNEPTLDWNTTSTIGSIGGVNLTITMPSNPNTHYIGYVRAGGSNSTGNAATTSGNTYINFVENNVRRSGVKLVPGNNMTITSDANGNITFSASGTNYVFENKNATLNWETTTTVATIGGVDITVGLPSNPNSDTHYTANLITGASATAKANAAAANGNVHLNLVENGTVRNYHKLVGSNGLTITSSSSGQITFTSPAAFTGASIDTNTGEITFTKSDGTTSAITASNITIATATGATMLVDGNDAPIDVGSTTLPVYFNGGVPQAIASIPWTLISDAPSSMVPSSHTHGNIQNDGILQTTDITITTGDKLVVTDNSNGHRVARASLAFDASKTSEFLTRAGTWASATFSLGTANNTTLGGVKPWYYHSGASTGPTSSSDTNVVNVNAITSNSGRYYAIESDINGRMFVNVPWNDSENHDVAMTTRGNQQAFLLGSINSPTSAAQNTAAVADSSVYIETSNNATRLVAPNFVGALIGTASGNVTSVQYDSTNSKLTYTKNGSISDIITIANLKTAMALNNVENTKLSTWTGSSNITTVGTISSGTWSGSTIAVNKGGTGKTSWTQYGVLYASGTTTLANTAAGAANTALMGKGSAAPAFVSVSPSISITAGTSSAAPQVNVSVLGVSGTAQSLTTASTSVYGVTKLTSDTSSTSEALAATPKLVKSLISGASNTYVTLNTAQTLTAAGVKTYLGQQIYGTNGLTLGVTSSSSVTQKAHVKYDSSLEAIVFSFA